MPSFYFTNIILR